MNTNDNVTGVLILRGKDRRNILAHALRYITTRPRRFRGQFEECNIDLCWVRGMGPYGGIMMRFSTNETTFGAMSDIDSLKELQDAIDKECHIAGEIVPIMTIAHEQFDVDPYNTHAVYYRRGYVKKGILGDDSLRRLLAIMAADKYIDVASYDRIVVGERAFKDAWRIYDLAGRGQRWLERFVREANRLSWDPAHGKMPYIIPYDPYEFQEFTSTTLQFDTSPGKYAHGPFLYVQAHSPDRRGLFSTVDRIARTAPGVSNPFSNRPVVRSCCRGIGGHGMVIMAVVGDIADATAVEEEMRARLDAPGYLDAEDIRFRHQIVAKKGKYKQVSSGQVSVTGTIDKPTGISRDGRQMYFTAKFNSLYNTPGILRDICEAAANVDGANASIYYLDARLKKVEYRRHQTGGAFVGAIGWIIDREQWEVFAYAVDKVIRPLCDVQRPPIYFPRFSPRV